MKCRVKDCKNHSDEGMFVGFLCSPCFSFLSTGEGKYSQLYRNTVAAEREACAKVCLEMWDKWVDSDRNIFDCPDAEDCATAIRARGEQ